MRRLTIALVALTVTALSPVMAQNQRLETFQANFASSNLETKLEILRAADSEDPAEFGPLYGQALSFVVSNAEQLLDEPLLREIALVAINRIDTGGYRPAVNDLWRLFSSYNETTARITMLGVLGRLAGEDERAIDNLASWVETQNNLTQAGTRVDLQVLASAADALGVLASPRAFEPLLDIILLQYPDFVTTEARDALELLAGDPLELAVNTIRAKDVMDKREVFSFMVSSDFLAAPDTAEFARATLADALRIRPRELTEQEEIRQIRFAAAAVIRESSYGQATGEAIRHFNETVLEYDRGRVPVNRVLEAIATLGAMGTDGAVQRLTDYMELLNTYTEIDRPYDTQIVLATITNLQLLDSPASYNALFYTTLLDRYPSRVRDAAREAMRAVSQ